MLSGLKKLSVNIRSSSDWFISSLRSEGLFSKSTNNLPFSLSVLPDRLWQTDLRVCTLPLLSQPLCKHSSLTQFLSQKWKDMPIHCAASLPLRRSPASSISLLILDIGDHHSTSRTRTSGVHTRVQQGWDGHLTYWLLFVRFLLFNWMDGMVVMVTLRP